MIVSINAGRPPEATVPVSFAPGEAAQVDFGAGPMLPDADGVLRRTWAFAITRLNFAARDTTTLQLNKPPTRHLSRM
jgi:hypothetical protein